MLQLVGSEAVVLSVGLVMICNGHAPDGEDAVDVVPHPGVVLGPSRRAIFVQEGWQESCDGVLCVRGGGEQGLKTVLRLASSLAPGGLEWWRPATGKAPLASPWSCSWTASPENRPQIEISSSALAKTYPPARSQGPEHKPRIICFNFSPYSRTFR